ncbi:methionine ABC transporter ATP-binding protein [Rouxiella badensis]|jgi:D-methionine transport system ATP-binding protein|uniref:Cell division ATP-binding protein FtsE n=1 Tax=Rouxiella badensis TaxID=1646377 RepID=A0A1X0WHJ0_9GAMM|nr:methionine ABC transporter ATP-binding protein [Rouxiella badensis]MCC3704485.1 methionine ABC transporter ATP-binding protein [Rouxiella badensis]MCC3731964.1 methionine ABC transporter ATP-binding protein [Rouxiella badensis]MCC3746532.1 methionine ABC transporter ATP-binding protein [Rouxiella badensis]MCC3757353.1 methionine ABC transporter ATP-binding protein [Rouxiella badensis]ORJ26252.1 methionine ABC transporter ATP-binding protein [Rouxiella badensis]
MIEIDNLHKHYPAPAAKGKNIEVLKGISLTVPSASITAVVGPSGAGKSTLAKCISLLEKPTSGSIRVNGKDLSRLSGEALRRERRAIGTVFQSSALLQRKTAWDNIALPLEWLGVVPRDIKKHVGQLLESVGLEDKAHHFPSQLSGGQRQRVGIARALALKPSVLLADEATSGLDPESTASILSLLKQLRDHFGLAIVLITHEMDVVRSAADAVAEIRDGRLLQQGSLQHLLAQPESRLGQQLFPLRPTEADGELVLQLSYGDRPLATDWISQLSQQYPLQVDVLAAHVEKVGERLAGRMQVAVRFTQRPLDTQTLIQQLYRLGINSEIIQTRAALQEAV